MKATKKKFLAFCKLDTTATIDRKWISINAKTESIAKKFLLEELGVKDVITILHALTNDIRADYEA